MIKVKNQEAVSLEFLRRLVLIKIFEPESLTRLDEALMEHSIMAWSKKAIITPEDKKLLEWCGWMLVRNEKGKLDRQKEIYRKHNVHWRKAYKCPKVPRAWLN